jgi:hypothetical protein
VSVHEHEHIGRPHLDGVLHDNREEHLQVVRDRVFVVLKGLSAMKRGGVSADR